MKPVMQPNIASESAEMDRSPISAIPGTRFLVSTASGSRVADLHHFSEFTFGQIRQNAMRIFGALSPRNEP